MSSVLHFRKELTSPPVVVDAPGIRVRQTLLPAEVPGWLALRERAMASEIPAVRTWTNADFRSEMTDKPWWRGDHSWVAVDDDASEKSRSIIGTVTLAVREGSLSKVPVVHWLLVDPEWHRRGVGRSLMYHLECAAWDVGWREVQLETHAGWSAAVAFYHSMGYSLVRERWPR